MTLNGRDHYLGIHGTAIVELSVSQIDHLDSYSIIVRDVSECHELQRQILEIAAEEDRRIGHELHDNIQQQLTGLSLLARTLADKLATEYPSEAPLAKRLADEINETARQVHLLARGLVPVEVDSQGLRASLMELAHKIADIHGIECEFRGGDGVLVTDNFAATHLYRIAQEALNNAVKHSRAKQILVRLDATDEQLTLEVSDDGIGIEEDGAFGSGMGLRIMTYRAGLIGGKLDVKRREGGGTTVSCAIRSGAASAGLPRSRLS